MKKFLALVTLSLFVFTSMNTSVFAQEIDIREELQEEHSVEIQTITLDDVPKNVTPLYFNTQEEADAYVLQLVNGIENESNDGMPISNPMAKATYGTALVDTYNIAIGGKVQLKVDYQTSSDANKGSIVYAQGYTVQSGLAIGNTWSEISVAPISFNSSTKDVYAKATGTVDSYIFFEGIGNIYKAPVTLSGYAYLIR